VFGKINFRAKKIGGSRKVNWWVRNFCPVADQGQEQDLRQIRDKDRVQTLTHCRGDLSKRSRRSTCATTRPSIPQLTTPTYLYLLDHPVFLVLFLTVVLPQSLWVHREGRSLSSAGSVPSSGGGPCSSFSRVGQLSLMPFLYLTVMHCGAGRRMASLCKL
jgi:hypothetical protein